MFENHCPANCKCEAADVWRVWTNALFYAAFENEKNATFSGVLTVTIVDPVYFF